MPRSKRVKVVSLTQTSKKTKEHKASVIQDVRDAIDQHDTLYLFSYENMRSNKFKDIRMHFRKPDMEGKESRIFLGKNKLLQIALGRTPEEEYGENLRRVSKLVTGSVGLLSTSLPCEEVETYFENMVQQDFARAGSISPRQVIISQELVGSHPVSMVDQFRKLGLPVEVQNGRLVLVGGKTQHLLCKEGATLSAEQCKLLVHFGIALAEFRVTLVCRWSSSSGSFEMLQ